MKRRLDGLSAYQQFAFAEEYVRRFGGRAVLGSNPADHVRIVDLPAMRTLDPETAQALADLDSRVYHARMARADDPR